MDLAISPKGPHADRRSLPLRHNQLARAVAGCLLLLAIGVAHGKEAETVTNYRFDDDLLLGSHLGVGQLSRFNRPDQVDPGTYNVDVFVNGSLITRMSVEFRRLTDAGPALPCLSDRFLVDSAHLLASNLVRTNTPAASNNKAAILDDQPSCRPLDQRAPGSAFKFDIAQLRLDLSIPQALMDHKPHGYVSPSEWNAGSSMGFVNYNASLYRSNATGSAFSTSDYGYLGVDAGINLGLWRLRQQGSYHYSDYAGQTSSGYDALHVRATRPSYLAQRADRGRKFHPWQPVQQHGLPRHPAGV
jgi:outer membrane usher protein